MTARIQCNITSTIPVIRFRFSSTGVICNASVMGNSTFQYANYIYRTPSPPPAIFAASGRRSFCFFLLIDFQTPVGHIFPRSIELLIYATSAVPLSVTAVIIRRRWFVRETKHGTRPTAVQTTSPVTPLYF